ncbi:MAG TPA: bifunctional phosphoribosylaminoimidazolecarboxamide formyltransferase/IMP cyclohydrolase [Candidatus Omnitrophota bacterium]|nr:bifunctional phosphoribosylaminoimidazolecarboxamide formyltransferase/IMP cyclohydrolase [Candidatus Omnitrophota bacterium]HPS36225.1 bifunctional phosphoribosylaminoimidazolecarboxamide formyltransferase/IMP cyclohydrolase [Candidatus Omnitrophota bacterium]
MSRQRIRRALISVSDKTGLIPFAKTLHKFGVEILSTGGTLKALKEAHVPAKAVDEFTGFPEMLDGRVKTLHPRIHGGLLYLRAKKSHREQVKKHGILPIDLVVVNLYPFESATSKGDLELEEAIEFVDIGGPSMLRSAAKNFQSVTVITDVNDYERVTRELEEYKGAVSDETRFDLTCKVFERTAAYDAVISQYMGKRRKHKEEGLPKQLALHFKKGQDLRYGENPHQKAAFYLPLSQSEAPWTQLHGKELSFNNLLDVEATLDILAEFSAPAACVIKHNNPCGIAQDPDIVTAVEMAIDGDSLSAFGGIVGINRDCDRKTAEKILEKLNFFEVIVAPSFKAGALKALQARKNLRIITINKIREENLLDVRVLRSGVLVQEKDRPIKTHMAEFRKNIKFVTKTKLSEAEIEDLVFAFQCSKVVKSNAIVLTQGKRTVGIGAGQMSRVDSMGIALQKAGYLAEGSYVGSDAFFPMPDSIEIAAKHKVKAIIQPGGSIRDNDVIAACDAAGIAMAFTGERHFRH